MTGLILEEDHKIPLLHLSLATRVGCVIDPPGKEGALRLLLRLMRRSAAGMSATEIDERLDSLGATLGIDASRSTAGFNGSVIARSLEPYLDLTKKIVTSPSFSEEEFEKIRAEALAEWEESLDNDSLLARRYFSRAFFGEHPYGRLAAGTPESLKRIRLTDLKHLYDDVFAGKCPLVAFSGDIEPVRANRYFEGLVSHFGAVPPRDGQADPFLDPAGPQGRHLTFVDKPERTQTQILIGCLGTHPLDPDHVALYVGHTVFGGTFGARLSQEVRGKRGWSYGAYSDLPFDRRRQVFSLWTFPQATDAAACIQLELSLLGDLIQKGVKASELSAVKKYLSNSHVFTTDTASKRASNALDREIYGLPEDYHASFVDRVKRLSVDEVSAALQKRLSSTNLEVTVVGTFESIGHDVLDALGPDVSHRLVPFDSRD